MKLDMDLQRSIKEDIQSFPIFFKDNDESLAREETLESLQTMINEHGKEVLIIIKDMIRFELDSIGVSIAAELLEIVGLLEDAQHEWYIGNMLGYFLMNSKSTWIRDGAIRGISYLDNPKIIYAVRIALKKETVPEIKMYMEQVLKELEKTEEGNQS